MTDLDKLITAVEAGTVGDDGFCPMFHRIGLCTDMMNAYHGSLDAAKALHEALLPGHFWFIGHLDAPELGYAATVASGHFPDSPSWRGYNLCPARAWLLAILKAYRAQNGKGGGE